MDAVQRDQPPVRRERARVLRTYSKRQAQESSAEPIPKRRRTTTDRTSEPDTAPQLSQLSPSQLPVPTAPQMPPHVGARKTSILNYFKPNRSSSALPSDELFSDPDKLVSTTPPSSSPEAAGLRTKSLATPPKRQQRPRRRSQAGGAKDTEEGKKGIWVYRSPETKDCIWVATEDVEEDEDEDDDTEADGVLADAYDEVEVRVEEKSMATNAPAAANQENPAAGQGLSEAGHGRGNERRTMVERRLRLEKSRKSTSPRSKSAPMVQTTLNLSLQPAFAECKVCNIVYNPQNPNDIKIHSRRHKLALRSKT